MKYMTLKNINKAIELIVAKGYSKANAQNIALNCFEMVGAFGGTVEEYISKLDKIEKEGAY